MSATDTSLKPACLMMPSSSIDLIAANCSSRGTFEAMRCNCQSPICSTPSFLQLRPCLGRDQHAAIRMKRFLDQLLGDIRPIGIGGIDKIDAELGQTPQGAKRLSAVGRRTPNARAGDAHGAEAEAMNQDVAADLEGAGLAGVELGRCVFCCHVGHRFQLQLTLTGYVSPRGD